MTAQRILAIAAALAIGALAPSGVAAGEVGAADSYARGDYVGSAEYWSEALAAARTSGNVAAEIAALELRAESHLALGFLTRAEADLTEALAKADGLGDQLLILRLKGMRGAVRTRIGDIDEARADLGESLLLAALAGERRMEAVTLNNIGNFLLLERRLAEAARIYAESAEIAETAGDAGLAWTARLNAAEVQADLSAHGTATALANVAEAGLTNAPRNATTVGGLIKLGRLNLRLATESDALEASRGLAAHRNLMAAREGAAALGNVRLESYAAGHLGQLYEQGGRWAEAARLTREAIGLAQRAHTPESLYLWQWQLGRILRAQGTRAEAIKAHEAAIETLSDVRSDIVAGFGTGRDIFEESVRPLILGLADLLLQESALAAGDSERQSLLAAARDTVELLKAAEFEDYFHDDCLAALNAKRQTLDILPTGTAALYPVVLPDRVELILGLGGRLERYETRIGERELERTVHAFRRGLTDPGSQGYLDPAAQLHAWLIGPAEATLDAGAVDTLVVVPSGLLASIPFAALRDGDGFLIERRAVAVAPGLSLIDPQPLGARQVDALLGGLTKSVRGFSPLPHVAAELAAVGEQYPSVILQDEQLVQDRLANALDRVPYGILHLATHAKFETEASESFLLTYDGRMDMEGLERLVRQSRFRDEPIELLTLSACSTAEGDPRAALGLAGVALKSGARSALASLWFVNDQSTAELVARFYAALGRPGVSKAEALRQAQLSLIADPAYNHPSQWAPFLVIGNWL